MKHISRNEISLKENSTTSDLHFEHIHIKNEQDCNAMIGYSSTV